MATGPDGARARHGPDADCGRDDREPSAPRASRRKRERSRLSLNIRRPTVTVAGVPSGSVLRSDSSGPARPSGCSRISWPSRTVPGWSHEGSALRAVSLIPSRRRSGAVAGGAGAGAGGAGAGAGAGGGTAAGVSGAVGSAGAGAAGRRRRRGESRRATLSGAAAGQTLLGQPLPAALARASARRGILRELRQRGHGAQRDGRRSGARGAEPESPPAATPATTKDAAKAAAAAVATRRRPLMGTAPAGCFPA